MTTAVRGRALLLVVPLIALLVSGCVNLPANSVVTAVSKQANTGSGSDVRIWPHGPQPGEQPEAIVEGFLQTAASDPTNHTIALSYLTGDAHAHWDSNKVIVFTDESSVTPDPNQADTLQISGTEVATVSDTGTYEPVQNPTRQDYPFHVVYDAKNGYRIDHLPLSSFGIALSQEAFRADYTSYYLYFLNKSAPQNSMIPIPVYQRSQAGDAATAQILAGYLLSGPPDWLSASAGIAAPSAALTGPGAVTIGPDDTALVAIKSPNYCTTRDPTACKRLADELMATFSSLASINRVTVTDSSGKRLLGTSSTVDDVMRQYHVAASGSRATNGFYYLDSATHHVFTYDGHNVYAEQVGPPELKYSQLAVTQYSGQATIAAMVDTTGSKLYLGNPGAVSPVVSWTGHRISSLSWDALGDLWFVDTVGGTPNVYRLNITDGLQSAPQRQNVIGTDGGVIQQIAAAPDGRRIAVVYSELGTDGSAKYSLGIGVVDDTSSPPSLNFSYGINEPVAFQWTNITGVDWHGSQSLAVLGYEQASSPLAISELNADGSPVVNSSDLNAVTINPPKGATGIEWAGNTLIASYSTSDTPALQEIEQYVFATGAWSVATSVNGTMPSYID